MVEPNYREAKDLRDVNYNMGLLVEKFNHEHTRLVERVSGIEKAIKPIPSIKTAIIEIKSDQKSNGRLLKTILIIISIVGGLLGIGAFFG